MYQIFWGKEMHMTIELLVKFQTDLRKLYQELRPQDTYSQYTFVVLKFEKVLS